MHRSPRSPFLAPSLLLSFLLLIALFSFFLLPSPLPPSLIYNNVYSVKKGRLPCVSFLEASAKLPQIV